MCYVKDCCLFSCKIVLNGAQPKHDIGFDEFFFYTLIYCLLCYQTFLLCIISMFITAEYPSVVQEIGRMNRLSRSPHPPAKSGVAMPWISDWKIGDTQFDSRSSIVVLLRNTLLVSNYGQTINSRRVQTITFNKINSKAWSLSGGRKEVVQFLW